MNLVILSSGQGSNLQKIIESVNTGCLYNCSIKLIVSNRNSPSIQRGIDNNIPTCFMKWNKKQDTRIAYDLKLVSMINSVDPDIIVLAGWNHILSADFLERLLSTTIINLHPALPGAFPGNNSIADALEAYKKGRITHTGIMVHKVTPIVDVGAIVNTMTIPIYKSDNLNSLKERIQLNEKTVLISAIEKMTSHLIKRGKVRDMYGIDDRRMIISHTDRLSAADKHVMDIPGKGHLLAKISEWWFNATKAIVNNHVIEYNDNFLVCHKCEVIPIEFVMRGYITGNSKTSMWRNYNEGNVPYCGINLQDGLIKNQKLAVPLLTPTTKADVDELISCNDIVDRNIVSLKELEHISTICHNLYMYGTYIAAQHNLILVDTKYEFGRTSDGDIILIDEVHTPDSSRYWVKDSYETRFSLGQEPEKLDKDCIRDYIMANPDYESIPMELQQRVITSYTEVYQSLSTCAIPTLYTYADLNIKHHIDEFRNKYMEISALDNNNNNNNNNIIVILSGSEKDAPHVDKIKHALKELSIKYDSYISSAHKCPKDLLMIIDGYLAQPACRCIFVTVAGRSNALSGVVAGYNKRFPVIACPPFANMTDMMVNINSTIQCPSYVPVMTILEPINVALSCKRIFEL